MTDARRRLPSIDRLLQLPDVADLLTRLPRNVVVAAAREAVAAARANRAPPPADWAAEIAERIDRRTAPSLFPVLNATGVVLHTNLGRAPLAAAAIRAVEAVARDYSNLELDLATGERGSRADHVGPLLAEVSGADDALVVNNAAGALVLALNALAAGREVIISRGELVEIGGSFRIPDILEKSGAMLREVGTTNRTHLADYDQAISASTGAILSVHRSNFAMSGFVTSPAAGQLAELARARGIPYLFDIGSGLLADLSPYGLTGEPSLPGAVAVADLVVASGDKLLGGPQAGCVAGRRAPIAALRHNPFARALRADKMTLAALGATLALYRDPARALAEIPVLRMLVRPAAELRSAARELAGLMPSALDPDCRPGRSAVGGGSFPDAELPTTVVALAPGRLGAAAFALKLRLGQPSIVARIERERIVLDPRTLADGAASLVAGAVRTLLAEAG